MLQYSRFLAVIFVAILRSTKLWRMSPQFCFRRRKTLLYLLVDRGCLVILMIVSFRSHTVLSYLAGAGFEGGGRNFEDARADEGEKESGRSNRCQPRGLIQSHEGAQITYDYQWLFLVYSFKFRVRSFLFLHLWQGHVQNVIGTRQIF